MPCLTALCLLGALAIDGDTLNPRDGEGPNVRLFGIDAPERDEEGYAASRDFLALMISGQFLSCEPQHTDRWGRVVAICKREDGVDLSCMQIMWGHATEWVQYSKGRYKDCKELK